MALVFGSPAANEVLAQNRILERQAAEEEEREQSDEERRQALASGKLRLFQIEVFCSFQRVYEVVALDAVDARRLYEDGGDAVRCIDEGDPEDAEETSIRVREISTKSRPQDTAGGGGAFPGSPRLLTFPRKA